MFEARLSQGAILKKVFEAVRELCQDVNIEVSESGLELQAMDNSHVSLVKLDFKKEAFDFYRCDRERSLGLNMSTVVKVMKLCNNEDTVTLRHQEGNDFIEFSFENETERKTSSFKMKLMVIDDERMGVPDIEFDSTVKLSNKLYVNTINQLGQFADIIKINVLKGSTVEFEAAGDVGEAAIAFTAGSTDDEDVVIHSTADTRASFGNRYLLSFAKAAPVSQTVTLKLSDKQPLLAIFTLNDDPTVGTLTFFLAPKMDDDMED